MVTIVLKGGLGNQAFQYAFGRRLEAEGNEVQFDLSVLNSDDSRAYALDRWNTKVKVGPRLGEFRHEFYREQKDEGSLLYKPEFIKKYDRDITIDGYWQCEKYFLPIQDQIRAEFTLRNPPSEKTLAVAREIENSESVFLHVRRTDNLSERGLAFHGLGSVEYWTHAVQEIFKKVSSPKFFIFSDDIEWCKWQSFFNGATFVDHNTTGIVEDKDHVLTKTSNGTECEDMFLMSRCKHAIMATSTFGWWGAWLIQNPKKVVVAPAHWFCGSYNEMSRDIIPETWARI
jgi:hypothetical protein